ncbi:hypothetical protein, partial [Bacillus pumilus]|uniref:hypothetical protein n=1 Tax=Bacillus pumilus TaxID=1408 RepID=UPI0028CB8FE0
MPPLDPPLPFIFTLIFLQTLPIFTVTKIKHSLNLQQIISFIILIASLLTPLPHITFQAIHPEHIFSRYVLFTFAFI